MGFWDSVPSERKKKAGQRQLAPSSISDRYTSKEPSPAPAAGSMVDDVEDEAPVSDMPVATAAEDPVDPTPAEDAKFDEDGDGAFEYEQSNSDLAYERNRDVLQSDSYDTTDEEAFVNQRILDQMGGDLVDSRARMGRAGMASGGGMAALEGDIMRQANLDAQGAIYDIREREQGQAFDELMGVQEIDIAQQEAASRAARDELALSIAQQLLGEGEPTGTPGEEGGPPYVGMTDDEWKTMTDNGTRLSGWLESGEAAIADGYSYVGTHDGYDYYEHADGRLGRVERVG